MRLKILKTRGLLLAGLSMLLCLPVVYATLAPDFTLTDIDGNTFSLSDFRGQVVILEFFATYCGSCIDEIPHLMAIQQTRSLNQAFVIVAVSIWDQDTNERLRQFRDEYTIPWILARDTANVRRDYGVSALPTLFVIDQDGYVAYQHIDVIVETYTLVKEVSRLLADVNGDDLIDISDLSIVGMTYGLRADQSSYDPEADVNQDLIIDARDTAIIAWNWGATVP